LLLLAADALEAGVLAAAALEAAALGAAALEAAAYEAEGLVVLPFEAQEKSDAANSNARRTASIFFMLYTLPNLFSVANRYSDIA
jgi:hypothetical protein